MQRSIIAYVTYTNKDKMRNAVTLLTMIDPIIITIITTMIVPTLNFCDFHLGLPLFFMTDVSTFENCNTNNETNSIVVWPHKHLHCAARLY